MGPPVHVEPFDFASCGITRGHCWPRSSLLDNCLLEDVILQLPFITAAICVARSYLYLDMHLFGQLFWTLLSHFT